MVVNAAGLPRVALPFGVTIDHHQFAMIETQVRVAGTDDLDIRLLGQPGHDAVDLGGRKRLD